VNSVGDTDTPRRPPSTPTPVKALSTRPAGSQPAVLHGGGIERHRIHAIQNIDSVMDVEYDDQEEEIDLFARDGPGAKQKARKRKAGRGSGRSQQTRSAQRHPRAPPPAAAAAPDPPEAAAAIPGPVSAVTRVDQQAVEQGEAVFAAADTAAEMTGPSWHNERPQYIQEYKESLIRQSGVKSLPGRSEMGQACFAVLRDVATAEGVFTGIKVSACMHPPHAGLVVMYMPGPHGHSHLHGSLVVLPLPTTARQIRARLPRSYQVC
jgi:hypothetical protein